MSDCSKCVQGAGALDPELDRVVIALAAERFPAGYDVVADAPSTYDELIAWVGAGNRMQVWSGAADDTIFGAPAVNFAFRAVHDDLHARHRLPFTLAGEAAVAAIHAELTAARAKDATTACRWQALILSDIVGQSLHHLLHGGFPDRQRLFVDRLSSVLLDASAYRR